MASTSVYFPSELLEELDRTAKESGTSRNRLIVDSCLAFLKSQRRDWPEGFFSDDHIPADDLRELRDSADEFWEDISASRRSREESPF